MPAQPHPTANPTGTQDFNLKPPADTPTPAPTTPPATTTLQQGHAIDAASLPGEAGLSSTGAVIGVAILLALAVGIFFIRGAVRSHLIANRASPSAASSAGWALFALLLSLSVLVLFGLLGNLWSVPAFTIPLSLLSLLMLVLFVLLYRAAARGRRPRS